MGSFALFLPAAAMQDRPNPTSPRDARGAAVDKWVPLSAKSTTVVNAEAMRGTYSRHVNGSTRTEVFSSDGKRSRVTIRNAVLRRIYVRDYDGRWLGAPMKGPGFSTPPRSSDFDKPNVSMENTSYERWAALRLTRSGGAALEFQTVIPDLNFLSVEHETTGRRDRLYEIVVGSQPDADFEPPPNASIEEFGSTSEMNEALRTAGRGVR